MSVLLEILNVQIIYDTFTATISSESKGHALHMMPHAHIILVLALYLAPFSYVKWYVDSLIVNTS